MISSARGDYLFTFSFHGVIRLWMIDMAKSIINVFFIGHRNIWPITGDSFICEYATVAVHSVLFIFQDIFWLICVKKVCMLCYVMNCFFMENLGNLIVPLQVVDCWWNLLLYVECIQDIIKGVHDILSDHVPTVDAEPFGCFFYSIQKNIESY